MADSWWTRISHPASGLSVQYDSADAEQQTVARILRDDTLVYGPSRNMDQVEAEYRRLVDRFLNELGEERWSLTATGKIWHKRNGKVSACPRRYPLQDIGLPRDRAERMPGTFLCMLCRGR